MIIVKIVSLLVCVAAVVRCQQDDFWFTEKPYENLSVVSGQSVTLKCNVSSTKHISFYWTLGGETVKNTTRRYQQASHLHITRLDPTLDSGQFFCIATNVSTGLSLTSLGYSLAIQWLDEEAAVELQSPKSRKEIVSGSNVVLKCAIEGSPDVRVEWYFNGARLSRNSRTSFKNKRLHINDASVTNNGLYSCKGSNPVGSIESKNKFSFIIQDENATKIEVIPADVIAKKEDTVKFDCKYDDRSISQWYLRDTGPLTNTSRMAIFPNGTLSITGIRGSDKGLYSCRGMSKESPDRFVQNYAAKLTISYLHEFPDEPFKPKYHDRLNVVAEKSAFEVDCKHPDGLPKPRIWWENPNGRVISDSGHIRVEDGRLVIDGATKGDSGKYSCVAENLSGQRQSDLRIEVTVPPKITSNPISIPIIDEGETTSLKCGYDASPYPLTEVMWLKDGNYVQEIGGHYINHKNNGTLEIHELTVSDVGNYMCEVRTRGYKSVRSREARILIKEKLKFVPPPIDKKLELGSNSKIYCKARGAAKPVVRWVKEGEILFDWPDHIRDDGGTLYFNGVKADDTGKYMCIATNSQGFINATIKVDVMVFPRFLVKPVDTSAYIGEKVMIHCKAYSDPVPAIHWDKNSVMNGFGNRGQVLENGTLLIENVELIDQGYYGCTAGNKGGLKREEVSLIVKARCNPSTEKCTKESSFMTKTVIITMSAASAYMFLVIGLMVWCRCRRAKRKAIWLAQADLEGKADNEAGPLTQETNHKSKNGTIRSDNEVPSHHSIASHNSRKSRSSYDRLQFPRHDLQMNNAMLIGKGEFGEVVLTRAKGIVDGECETTVMVKALQTRDENVQFEFKREMDMFHKLNHENIAKLLGVCREAEPALVVLEYTDVGDLKQFLLATRKDNQRKGLRPSPLTHAQIIHVCSQIATGMEHLSNHRFIHKDLAARNCLISSSLDVKITMQQLCRDTYSSEYVKYNNHLVPARWLAPEAFLEDEYSTKSDVWSYAVLVWEVLNQAKMPFGEHSDETVVSLLQQKRLNWNPSDEIMSGLLTLLIQCWSDSPKYRPTFSEIVIQIGDMAAENA